MAGRARSVSRGGGLLLDGGKKEPADETDDGTKGPLMKMPNMGPWLDSGMKIMGPKKPPRNPTMPRMAAPRNPYWTYFMRGGEAPHHEEIGFLDGRRGP